MSENIFHSEGDAATVGPTGMLRWNGKTGKLQQEWRAYGLSKGEPFSNQYWCDVQTIFPAAMGKSAITELHGSGVCESEPLTRSGLGRPDAVKNQGEIG